MKPLGIVGVWDVTDFMLSAPLKRVRVVRQLKGRRYDVLADYYKRWREAVMAVAQGQRPMESLRQSALAASDRKRENFLKLTEKLQSFLFVASGEIVEAERFGETLAGMEVRVTPEFVLCTPVSQHPTKLWLKKEPPTQNQVETFLAVSDALYRRRGNDEVIPALLDVPREKLHWLEDRDDLFADVLDSEMQALARLWELTEV